MIRYPISFHGTAEAVGGLANSWDIQASGFKACCSVPPEFMGPGGAFSPEDLFNQALVNCFIGTFKVYAANSKLNIEKIDAQSELVVDLNSEKKPVMKSFKLKVNIKTDGQIDKAKLLAKKAFESGFILNSVKTETELELNVE